MKLMKVAAGVLLTMSAGIQIATANGEALFASKACVACHGPEGNKPNIDTTPKLAGQNKGYLIQQLKDIKSGARSNGGTVQMKGIAAGLSDDDIEAISAYLSGIK